MSLVPSLSTVSIVVTNGFLIPPKYPLDFLTLSLGASYFLVNGPLDFLTFSLGAYEFLGNGPVILDDTILVLDMIQSVNSRIGSRF